MLPAEPLTSAPREGGYNDDYKTLPGLSTVAGGLPADLTPPRSRSPVSRFDEPTEFSIDEAIAHLGTNGGRFQLKLLFGTGTFMVSTSLQFSILSFLGSIVQCQLPGWNVSDESAALLATLVFFGMLVGTFVWGTLADMYGRKPVRPLSFFLTHETNL